MLLLEEWWSDSPWNAARVSLAAASIVVQPSSQRCLDLNAPSVLKQSTTVSLYLTTAPILFFSCRSDGFPGHGLSQSAQGLQGSSSSCRSSGSFSFTLQVCEKDGWDPFYGALSYGSMPKSAHPLRESPDRKVYRIVAQPYGGGALDCRTLEPYSARIGLSLRRWKGVFCFHISK